MSPKPFNDYPAGGSGGMHSSDSVFAVQLPFLHATQVKQEVENIPILCEVNPMRNERQVTKV